MNKSQAKKKVFDYFKKNAIEYKFVNEELKLIDVDSLDTIYLCASIPEVIGGHIETCIRFREEHLYCQSYYCQPVVHNEEEAIRAARLINYLNRHLKYECDILYSHVYILDEDNGDISVVGHTVTEDRKIWVSPSGRTIRIDCGGGYQKDGNLGAIRLNDMEEFYVSS